MIDYIKLREQYRPIVRLLCCRGTCMATLNCSLCSTRIQEGLDVLMREMGEQLEINPILDKFLEKVRKSN